MAPKSFLIASVIILLFNELAHCFGPATLTSHLLDFEYAYPNHHHYGLYHEEYHNDDAFKGNRLMETSFDDQLLNRDVTEQRVVNVKDYGAKGDGTDDSQAFSRAWKEACSSSTSAILLIPKDNTFLLKPITFSGPCKSTITVMIKGNIKASAERSDWNGKNSQYWILFANIDNMIVQGGGTINGSGKIWWQNSCKINKSLPCKNAPTALTFYSCNNLKLENLVLKDSQQIHLQIQKCNTVQASDLSITAPETSPNTDGIHITSTQNLQIYNAIIKTGDDCISIVTGSQNIKASKIVCGPGHGISIGSLGSENSAASVSDVTIDNAQLDGTTNGVRIKSWQGGQGYAKNIIFSNIAMNNVKNPIIIDQSYCDSTKPCPEQKSAVKVSNVMYKNIKGTSASKVAIKLNCSRSVPCQGIQFQTINLVYAYGASTESVCGHAEWTKSGSVVPTPCGQQN